MRKYHLSSHLTMQFLMLYLMQINMLSMMLSTHVLVFLSFSVIFQRFCCFYQSFMQPATALQTIMKCKLQISEMHFWKSVQLRSKCLVCNPSHYGRTTAWSIIMVHIQAVIHISSMSPVHNPDTFGCLCYNRLTHHTIPHKL